MWCVCGRYSAEHGDSGYTRQAVDTDDGLCHSSRVFLPLAYLLISQPTHHVHVWRTHFS